MTASGELDALEAAGRFRDALAALDLPAGRDPYRDAVSQIAVEDVLHRRGRLLWRLARFDAAERALSDAFDARRARLGDDHLDTLDTAERLAALAHYQKRDEIAETRFRFVIERLDHTVGPRHLRAGIARRNYAAFLRDAGDEHAAPLLRDATRTIVATAGRGSPDHVAALKVEALLVFVSAGARRAKALAADAMKAAAACHGADHVFTAAAELTLAMVQHADGMAPLALIERARATLERGYGEHPLVALALDCEAQIRVHHHDADGSHECARRAIAMLRTFYPGDVLNSFGLIANDLMRAGRFHDVIALADEHLALPLDDEARDYVEDFRGTAIDWLYHVEGDG